MVVASAGLAVALAACGAGDDDGTSLETASEEMTADPAPSSTSSTAPAESETMETPPAAETGDVAPVELEVESEAAPTSSTLPPDQWETGGRVTATGVITGDFDVLPRCDPREDTDGEYLNVAFGYEDFSDPDVPTVRVVTPVHGWRDEGDFEAPLEAQYQTGTGMDLTLTDATGTAQVSIEFIDSLGVVPVARIGVSGNFGGPVEGAVEATLTCLAG